MQIKPVSKANKPEYPTASEIDIPKVLNASKPNKWKRNAAIGAVMLAIVGNISSCTNINTNNNDKTKRISGIAPLFEHGDGFGSEGCIIVSPPVYLSESDAREIIINEFEDNGILYIDNKDTLKGVCIQSKRHKSEFNLFSEYTLKMNDDTMVTKTVPFEVYLDSSDFAVIFVSSIKFDEYGNIPDYGISIYSKKIKSLARKIQKAGKNQNKSFVVFYDPITDIERKHYWFWEDDDETIALKTSKKELRKQIQDFIKWYKENKGKK